MTDTVLDLLTWALLGLLYLFFARVLWTVWAEVRASAPQGSESAVPTRNNAGTNKKSDTSTDKSTDTSTDPSTDPTIDLADITVAAQHLTPHRVHHDSRGAHRNNPASRENQGARGTRGLLRTAAHEITFLAPRSHKGHRITLEADTILTIGRADACTLPFPDDTYISGLHAQIRIHEGQPVIEDLGSTNGTFHNGNRLHGLALLHPGDRVQIGQTVLEAR